MWFRRELEAVCSLWNKAFARVGARTLPLQHLLCGVYERSLNTFQGGQRHHGRSGAPQEGSRGGVAGEATDGEPVLAILLWDMLYADDAGVATRLPEQLRKMMGVIVVVCAAFGLTVSEAQTEMLC